MILPSILGLLAHVVLTGALVACAPATSSDPDDGAPTDQSALAPAPAPRPAPAPSPTTPPAGSTGVTFRRAPPGTNGVHETRLSLKLDANVGVGPLRKTMTYELVEKEHLLVEPLGDDGTRLQFLERWAKTTAPLVGEEKKDRRVAGKSYLVRGGPGAPTVTDAAGSAVRDKEARDVLLAWEVVGGEPPLFSVLPEGALLPGASLALDGTRAKRLLNLPLEQLEVDGLTLVLRDPTGSGAAEFDAQARLSGTAELAGAQTSLSGSIAGRVTVDPATSRLLGLEMRGTLEVEREGELMQEGRGPIEIRRTLRPAE